MDISVIEKELRKNRGAPEKRKVLSSFFKCGKGQYGEGDKFLGVPVPYQRKIARLFFRDIAPENVPILLQSSFHEVRLTALFLWVYQFGCANKKKRERIYHLYQESIARINNWDLVDVTAPAIVGSYLWDYPSETCVLQKLGLSKNMWQRRIAIVATLFFIRKNNFTETFKLAEICLKDTEDLIHKATGWMLREVGKRNRRALEIFLEKNVSCMSRTTLRYAIEKFDTETKKAYLNKK